MATKRKLEAPDDTAAADGRKRTKKEGNEPVQLVRRNSGEMEKKWEIATSFAAFSKRVTTQSIYYAQRVFPSKILKLASMRRDLEKKKQCLGGDSVAPMGAVEAYGKSLQEGKEQLGSRPNIPCNESILEVTSQLKSEIVELIDMLTTMKCWLALTKPQLEDGNNFGVQVQMGILSNITAGCQSARNVLNQFHSYHFQRGKYVRRCEKHPKMDDWKITLQFSDEKQHDEAINVVGDLQALYMTMHDRLMKNWAFVNEPKGNRARASSNIYF
jgi:hypothetical protein